MHSNFLKQVLPTTRKLSFTRTKFLLNLSHPNNNYGGFINLKLFFLVKIDFGDVIYKEICTTFGS